VVSGRVDAAALDITVWRKFVDEKRVDTSKVDVFYTTPPFYNYNWSVHADMPAALRERVTKALLDLSWTPRGQGNPDPEPRHQVHPDQGRELQGLETAGRSAGLIK
jgi:phosphonate transport system substrate-binding protein